MDSCTCWHTPTLYNPHAFILNEIEVQKEKKKNSAIVLFISVSVEHCLFWISLSMQWPGNTKSYIPITPTSSLLVWLLPILNWYLNEIHSVCHVIVGLRGLEQRYVQHHAHCNDQQCYGRSKRSP